MDNIIMAAGGVVQNEKGEVLLILRKKHWDLPKGKLDEGEELEACAIREVQEETGLSNVQLGKFIDTTVHEYDEDGKHIIKKTAWYLMKGSSLDTVTPQTEEHIEEIRWVSPGSVESYLQQSYPNIIQIMSKALAML